MKKESLPSDRTEERVIFIPIAAIAVIRSHRPRCLINIIIKGGRIFSEPRMEKKIKPKI